MPLTDAAMWLNDFFFGYDHALLSLMHSLASGLGGILTPLTRLVTLLGEHGIIFYALAVFCALFADRRDTGVCIFGAVCCGALITNIILKDNICRPRPFVSSDEFYAWWQFIGAPAEEGFSFPSGHVTSCAAGMTALCNMKGKKLVLPSVVIVLVMMFSRNYLMAHYPSDVLVAAIIGVFSGFVAWFITQLIFRFLRQHSDMPVFDLMLNFDVREILPFELPAGEGIGAMFKSLAGRADTLAVKRTARSARAAEDDADGSFFDEDADADMKTYTGRKETARSAPRSPAKQSRSAAVGRHETVKAPKPEERAQTETSPYRFSVNDLNDVAAEKPPVPRRRAESKAAPAKRPAAPRFKAPGTYKGKHEL